MMLKGIDVSRFQHPPYQAAPIDWAAVKASGVEWVAYQALKGESIDPSFGYNRDETERVGFAYRLAYGYPTTPQSSNQPTAMPWADQARLFAEVIGALRPGEGVMCDAETEGITEPATLTWCETVETSTGRPCAVYTGAYVAGGAIWLSTRLFDGRRPRVFAAYTSENAALGHAHPYEWDCWQYSGTGSCPGVRGACDLDRVDRPAPFDACCGRGLPVEDDRPLFVMVPEGGWWPPDYVPAWLVRYSSGRAAYATSADVAYAEAHGVPRQSLRSAPQYNQVLADERCTYPKVPL